MNVWTLAVGQCASAAQKQQPEPSKGNCVRCGKPLPKHRRTYCNDICMRNASNQKRATTRAGRKAALSEEQ